MVTGHRTPQVHWSQVRAGGYGLCDLGLWESRSKDQFYLLQWQEFRGHTIEENMSEVI